MRVSGFVELRKIPEFTLAEEISNETMPFGMLVIW